jgi:hypothetical protein
LRAHELYPLRGVGADGESCRIPIRNPQAGARPERANRDPARIALRHTNPSSITVGRSPDSRLAIDADRLNRPPRRGA